MAKKAFRVILLILAAVIIAAAMLLLYLTVTEYRPADKEDAAILSAKAHPSSEKAMIFHCCRGILDTRASARDRIFSWTAERALRTPTKRL